MIERFKISLFLLLPLAVVAVFPGKIHAQLYLNYKISPQEAVQNILMGMPLQERNIKYKGAVEAMGLFANKNTNLPLDSGVVLSTGHVNTIAGQNASGGMTGMMGRRGDDDLTRLANTNTFDAVVLMFDFVPQHEIIKFDYVFGSEEYPEYVDRGFNDVFGFWLINLKTGDTTNLAVLPETGEPITIDMINHLRYTHFYVDNTKWVKHSIQAYTIEFDGFTKPLLAFSEVEPGTPYRIKIAIADAGDSKLDSGVFLKGRSFKSKTKEEFYEEYKDYFDRFEGEREKLNLTAQKEDVPKTKPTKKPTQSEQKTSESEKKVHTVYFDFDRSEPSPDEISRLNNFLNIYSAGEVKKVVVKGHTDNFGSKTYNDNLSKARAESVKRLVNNKNLTQSISMEYFNYSVPARKNETPEGRRQNRRVEVEVVTE